MATGVETAGLVLGSIPLVLASLEFYAKGIAVTKRYWRYREEFETLLVELKIENTLCMNSINILLKDVVRDEDMADFLADPGGQGWKEESFEKRLKQRLASSYISYSDTIQQMNNAIESFKERLKLDSSGQPQFTQENKFKEHYRRLKFSLNKADYKDLMSRVRQANLSLYQLTTQTMTLETPRASLRSTPPAIPRFGIVHDRAQGFYTALQSGWKCACHADHSVSLRLEPRMEDTSSDDEDEEADQAMKEPFHVVFRNEHTCTTSPRAWTWEEADVRVECQPTASSRKDSVGTGNGVRFAQQAQKAVKAALNPIPNLQPIQDLCTAICTLQNPQRDICLSLLASEVAKQKYGILIYPPRCRAPDPEAWTTSPLREVLQHSKFTKKDRLRLAVTLAATVLQLHETGWLEENWGKDTIFFASHGNKIIYDHSFVSRSFHGTNMAVQTSPNSDFMSRIIRNQTLYALGRLLIEIWYSKPIHELFDPDDGPMYTGDPRTDSLTEWNTVNRLVEDLYSDAGAKYSDAVRRCIRCEFDRHATSLSDTAFQQAVYQGVVAELKENYDFLF